MGTPAAIATPDLPPAVRTRFDQWIRDQERKERHGISSEDIREKLLKAAKARDIPDALVPSRKGIDDMRGARYYPSHVIALLIQDITGGEIGLQQWANDFLQFGTRRRGREK